jgi:predicted anti-sigma-YlaC factor YlaD
MTCRDVIEFLADYLNGELTREERDLFLKHLGVCPPCIAYLQTYEETIILSKSAMEASHDLPPAPEELVRAILASRPSSDQPPG